MTYGGMEAVLLRDSATHERLKLDSWLKVIAQAVGVARDAAIIAVAALWLSRQL